MASTIDVSKLNLNVVIGYPSEQLIVTKLNLNIVVGPASEDPEPEITSISPTSGPEAGGTVVTILGSYFTDVTDVQFGGAPVVFTIVDDNHITFETPAGTGLADLSVTNAEGTSTLLDAFEYVAVVEGATRVTQTPVLATVSMFPPARVTQSPVFVLSLPLQGSRVTQATPLVVWGAKPVPLPLPLVPEVPVQETWGWLTALSSAKKRREQRAALRSHPRLSMAFSARLLADADREHAYNVFLTYAKTGFNYPLYQYATPLTADAAIGDTRVKFNSRLTDVREGEAIAFVDQTADTTRMGVVATVLNSGVILTEPLKFNLDAGSVHVAPAPRFRLLGSHTLTMQALGGDAAFKLEGMDLRPVLGEMLTPVQYNNLLTMYDGLLVLPDPQNADGNVDEEFDGNVKWRDNGINSPSPYSSWLSVYTSGIRRFLVHRPQGMDYWRAVANHLVGRQKTFLLPTHRDDLPLLTQPAAPADTSFVTSNVYYAKQWAQRTWRYLAIRSDAGVTYRKVIDTEVNYDPAGDPVSVTARMSAPFGNTAAHTRNLRISYANVCRLDNDNISLNHGNSETMVDISFRMVDE